MRATVIILLACATASARLYCPVTYEITKTGVDKSTFVAEVEVESNTLTKYWSGYYYDVKVKYVKLLRWWHDWLTEEKMRATLSEIIYIHSGCGVYLRPGQKYIIGCLNDEECNFAKTVDSLTPNEKVLANVQ
ncbi:hypothetical protein ANCCAN_10183 [Ancylostoma caninum]|uniref:Tissue inhibitor of metalloproteinase n=1 Tax=Ancylostoma caninum TaxID=29170 RepID=A0A368GHD8_ANCCA|nr:hypothetical protein ANCCAN_10183 [Ancylostoma caninum]